MLKILGALLLSITVGSVGFKFSEGLLFRKRYLEALEWFATMCIDEMRYKNSNIFDIFWSASRSELKFLNEINKDNVLNKESISLIVRNSRVVEKDVSLIVDFLISLGDGDIEGQTAHCRYYSEKFHALLNDAKDEFYEKGRLFKSLSVSAGVALFIILI